MKKIFFLILIFLISEFTFSQSQSDASSGFFSFTYKLPNSERVYLVGVDRKNDSEKVVLAKYLRFKIRNKNGDTIYIRFKNYSDYAGQASDPNYNVSVNKTNVDKKFYLLEQEGELFRYKYTGLSWGVIIAPEKIRLKTTYAGQSIPLALTTNISIGPYIGFQWGTKEFGSDGESSISSTIAAFLSPYTSFTELSSANSKDSSTNGTTVSALTLGFGYLFNISNKFQIGALVGWDYVGGAASTTWYYQGKAWYSIAIGFNFTK